MNGSHRIHRLLSALLGLCIALASLNTLAAEVYKTVDASGKVIYTDVKPSEASEPHKLPAINTQQAGKRKGSATRLNPKAAPKFNKVKILYPLQGNTIFANQGGLTIRAQALPSLPSGATLQAFINGAPQGRAGSSTEFPITDIERGTKTISVIMKDREGKVLATSETVTIHVKRPSLNLPGRKKAQT
jgi:hypothetical protein